MRCNRANNNEEEPDYWAPWGYRLFRLGYLADKAEQAGLTPEEDAELSGLRGEVPEAPPRESSGKFAVPESPAGRPV